MVCGCIDDSSVQSICFLILDPIWFNFILALFLRYSTFSETFSSTTFPSILSTWHEKVDQNSELTIAALSKILSNDFFKGKADKTLSIWSDNGRNIKSTKTIAFLFFFFIGFSKTLFKDMKLNYFAPYHGKSDCDRHFGCLKTMIRSSLIDVILTSDLLRALLRLKNTTFIELRGMICSKKSTWEM